MLPVTIWLWRGTAFWWFFAVVCLPFPIKAQPAEGLMSWRTTVDRDLSSLFVAESQSTDFIASPSFECIHQRNEITVKGEMDEATRHAFAEMIRRDDYPEVTTVPPTRGILIEPRYSDIAGWEYRFRLSSDHESLNVLATTGRFSFKFGEASIAGEFKIGLKAVAQFLLTCRSKAR